MSVDFLQTEFLNNRANDYLMALGMPIVSAIAIKGLQVFLLKPLKHWVQTTPNNIDNAMVRIIESRLIPALYLGTIYIALRNLNLHPILEQTIDATTAVIATLLGIRLIVSLIEYLLRVYCFSPQREELHLDQSLKTLLPAIRAIVWGIGIIFLLDNLGFNVSAVVASLGIGGVAIALASQGVLQDLFSYFAILLDRPFELGDFIIVGDYLGTVEQVGIKTTRLQSLSGEEIIMANTDLTSSRIRNFKRMAKRRVEFKIGVAYETSLERLKEIPLLLRNILEETECVVFDRAHFSHYDEFSLIFEIVYFVTSNDYNQYMDVQQTVNFRIKQEFEKRAIAFAYPLPVNLVPSLSSKVEPVESCASV
ncbi:MAG: mechanosensitive ion channel family protein [Cyanobacteriota bacterium]|nr:mechanosensitive ion channel family protein [Cyanobacteriota bacterium]